jgi:TonB family protein
MRIVTPYGAFELKRVYQKNLGLAVLIAGLVNFLLMGSFLFFTQIKAQRLVVKRVIRIKDIIELGVPPSLTQSSAHQIAVSFKPTATLPSVGIPRAVPDNQISETRDLATQKQLGILHNPTIAIEGIDKNESLDVQLPVKEYYPAQGEFVPVQEIPVMVKEVKPIYPELARRSGVEGIVWLDVLVDKHGKVREAKCLKEQSVNLNIFCEAAIQAVLQCEFRPAISNNVPVACWGTTHIDFVLK